MIRSGSRLGLVRHRTALIRATRISRASGARDRARLSRAGTIGSVALALYAGICVSDYHAALPWYESLLGSEPSFLPHATEAVWELAEERYVYIEEDPGRAGHARQTLFVDDLDSVMSEIAARGMEPADVETYSNGVRKAVYRDADGNEVGFGGAPA